MPPLPSRAWLSLPSSSSAPPFADEVHPEVLAFTPPAGSSKYRADKRRCPERIEPRGQTAPSPIEGLPWGAEGAHLRSSLEPLVGKMEACFRGILAEEVAVMELLGTDQNFDRSEELVVAGNLVAGSSFDFGSPQQAFAEAIADIHFQAGALDLYFHLACSFKLEDST